MAKLNKGMIGLAATIIAIFVAIIIAASFLQTVAPNEVGVKVRNYGSGAGVQPEIVQPGWTIVGFGEKIVGFPTYSITKVWTKDQTEDSPTDESMSFGLSRGVKVTTDMSMTISFDPQKAPLLYQKYKRGPDEIINNVLRNVIRNALTSNGPNYDAEGFMQGDAVKLAEQVRTHVNKELGQYGLIVEQFGFINKPILPGNIENSINETIAETQKAIKSEAQARTASAVAAVQVATAKGAAEAKMIEAQAEADALKVVADSIRANGDAAAKLKVEMARIEKWDGQTYFTIDGKQVILNADAK